MADEACPAQDFLFQTPFPCPFYDTGLSPLMRGQIIMLVSMLMATYLRCTPLPVPSPIKLSGLLGGWPECLRTCSQGGCG